MKRMWVGIVFLGLVAAACGSTKKSVTTTTTAAVPTSTTSTTQLASAADVRTKIGLLFGDYQLIFDKSADALLGGRTEESIAYSTQLNANGTELGDLIGRTYGDDARAKFTGIWSAHTGYLFDYVSGTAKSDKATQDGAVFVLTNTFVPQFSDFFSSTTGLAKDAATNIATQHVSMTKAFIDAESTKDWSKAVKDDTAAFSQIQKIADSLSTAVSAKDSVIYPATGTTRASDLRVALNLALERHSYLVTDATGAVLGARIDEFTALNDELIVNTGVIGSVLASVNGLDASNFANLWTEQNSSFGLYAAGFGKNDKPAQDSALKRPHKFIRTTIRDVSGGCCRLGCRSIQAFGRSIDHTDETRSRWPSGQKVEQRCFRRSKHSDPCPSFRRCTIERDRPQILDLSVALSTKWT